jgi:hypothetical protein
MEPHWHTGRKIEAALAITVEQVLQLTARLAGVESSPVHFRPALSRIVNPLLEAFRRAIEPGS